MGWFGRKESPKDNMETTEDDEIVEINTLYDSEKRFGRVGDKHAAMIQSHHVRKAIDRYHDDNPGDLVDWDSKADRYYKYDGRKLR